MITRSVFVLAMLSLTMAAGASMSQQQVQVPQTTIRSKVELVNVVFAATDRDGKMVSGLKAEDFQVFEDKKPQTIDYFNDWTRDTEVPLTIALLTGVALAWAIGYCESEHAHSHHHAKSRAGEK